MIATEKPPTLIQHRGLRQFVKFCIVGLSSSVISFSLLNILYYRAGIGLVQSVTVSFLISVFNGFFWNRKWTFKEARSKAAHTQYLQFFLVNVVGLLLNNTVVILIIVHFAHPGHGLLTSPADFWSIFRAILSGEAKKQYPPLLLNGAQAAAVCVVVFWNFFANRLWTFKH